MAVFTFNYDRSLEWLLFSACKATYGVNDKAAAEFVSGVHIEHFYGATTTLHQLNNAGVKFDCDRANLHLAVERAEQEIWLIDDDRKRQESVFANASQTIGGAKIATFLGYGFDEINDGKLGVAQLIAKTKRDNIARAERLKSAPTIHHIPSGKVELHPKFILPKERSVPRFQATTLGMYEREVTSALGRSGLSRGDRDGQISTLSKNCHEALREWGTFDLLR